MFETFWVEMTLDKVRRKLASSPQFNDRDLSFSFVEPTLSSTITPAEEKVTKLKFLFKSDSRTPKIFIQLTSESAGKSLGSFRPVTIVTVHNEELPTLVDEEFNPEAFTLRTARHVLQNAWPQAKTLDFVFVDASTIDKVKAVFSKDQEATTLLKRASLVEDHKLRIYVQDASKAST